MQGQVRITVLATGFKPAVKAQVNAHLDLRPAQTTSEPSLPSFMRNRPESLDELRTENQDESASDADLDLPSFIKELKNKD